MTKDEVAALVRGRTLHHTLAEGSPQGRGVALFFFGEDGRATARLPDGRVMHGDYVVEEDGYTMSWDGGLQNSRSTLTREGVGWACRNAADGALRSTVTTIEDGDTTSMV